MSQALAEPRTLSEVDIDAVVLSAEPVAEDIVLLRLGARDGALLPAWAPGAHLDLVLGEDLVRQYSLCGDPADLTHYEVAVLRAADSRGGSVAVWGSCINVSCLRSVGPRPGPDSAENSIAVFAPCSHLNYNLKFLFQKH